MAWEDSGKIGAAKALDVALWPPLAELPRVMKEHCALREGDFHGQAKRH
jgi:hypothetical protein